jgi:hypothetical protein
MWRFSGAEIVAFVADRRKNWPIAVHELCSFRLFRDVGAAVVSP